MAWLAMNRRPVSLDEAVALLEGRDMPAGPPPVVVTFDDGTLDFVDHAVPVLARHRVPATLYLATDFVERQRTFPSDATPVTWSGLAEALSTNLVTIGSHTHTHALLDRLPDGEVADELDRSVALIGERLGVEARHFAYPKAVAGSPAADEAVRTRFRSAALAGTRTNPYGTTDLHRLARSPIQVSDQTRWFRRKARGGMAVEDGLRRALNRRRYTDAIT
jgi:peptidoglycan/xylan/chitin deacetylase (PgdA/CDA1 family)